MHVNICSSKTDSIRKFMCLFIKVQSNFKYFFKLCVLILKHFIQPVCVVFLVLIKNSTGRIKPLIFTKEFCFTLLLIFKTRRAWYIPSIITVRFHRIHDDLRKKIDWAHWNAHCAVWFFWKDKKLNKPILILL